MYGADLGVLVEFNRDEFRVLEEADFVRFL